MTARKNNISEKIRKISTRRPIGANIVHMLRVAIMFIYFFQLLEPMGVAK